MKPKNDYPLSGKIEYNYHYKPKVCFIMQYFKKPELIKRIIKNIRKISDNLEIIISNDSSSDIDIFKECLDHRNDIMICSKDLGEYIGYNNCVKLTNAEFIIIAQDDDVPPDTNIWWHQIMDKFKKDQKLGLINLFKGGFNYASGSQDKLICDGTKGFKYTNWNAIGPFIMRRKAFLKCGMFDSKYFRVGECGGGADAALSTRMWLNGYRSAILDTSETIKYGRRVGGRTTERNGKDSIIRKNTDIRIILNNSIYKKEFLKYNPIINREIFRLNTI